MNKIIALMALGVAGLASTPVLQAQGRDYISIVGSSTVYPFTTVVAERFGDNSRYKTPKVESTGSGGGLQLFCQGVGVDHPDITNASRRIKASELAKCQSNGVDEVVEVLIGYDGIVVANAREAEPLALSREQLFLALAKQVPNPDGEGFVANPHRRWQDIDPDLPDRAIDVLGPPPTSGTRDAFVELVMEAGCREVPAIAALETEDSNQFERLCQSFREDGAFVEAGENDNLIVQKLDANPATVGIFGYSFLDQNTDKVQPVEIDGIAPTFDTIADQDYPVSRPLYLYVKAAHADAIPGMGAFLDEFTSDRAWGDFGYLADKGMIPLPQSQRDQVLQQVESMEPVDLDE